MPGIDALEYACSGIVHDGLVSACRHTGKGLLQFLMIKQAGSWACETLLLKPDFSSGQRLSDMRAITALLYRQTVGDLFHRAR
jgi:hypothetical protein